MGQLPSPSYFDRLPYEISCSILARLPLAELFRLSHEARWKPILDRCSDLGARYSGIIYVALGDLLVARWSRSLPYVLTDFPSEPGSWPGWISQLAEQPVLGIRISSQQTGGVRMLRDLAHPPLDGRRIILRERRNKPLVYAVVQRFEEGEYSLYSDGSSLVFHANGKETALGGTALNRIGYELFSHADLGLVNPALPPAKANPPLRDVLTMFWTYVCPDVYLVYAILDYLGGIRYYRREEGNYIWLAPQLEEYGAIFEDEAGVPDDEEELVAYFQKFDAVPGRNLRVINEPPWTHDIASLDRDFSFGRVESIADAFSTQVPRPYPDVTLEESNKHDLELITAAFNAYRTNSAIYMVNGELISGISAHRKEELEEYLD